MNADEKYELITRNLQVSMPVSFATCRYRK